MNRHFKENSSAYDLEQGVAGQSSVAYSDILVPYMLALRLIPCMKGRQQ